LKRGFGQILLNHVSEKHFSENHVRGDLTRYEGLKLVCEGG